MNHTPMIPRWLKATLCAIGWLVTMLSALAQTGGSGSIQGRVYNPASKEYVRNAEVRIEGTNHVTYTENDGSFQFINVPAGEATVSVTFVGYNTAKETFRVAPGQTAVREINLMSAAATTAGKDGVVQLQAFTVSSEREGNAKAIQAQRREMNIITSVSSDLFGDVADGNVGEFLKYLPGVDLDYVESEPRGPRLGGMDGQYVGVAFDGMRTASADANRGGDAASRATSFEGFSITSIDSIEINWTSTPENDADSPAGTVNMRTKRAFNQKGRVFTYNLSASLNSEEFTLKRTDGPRDEPSRKWGPNYILSYAESFFDQKFGLLLSASHSYSYTEQIISTAGYNASPTAADPRPLVARQIDFKDGPKFITKDSLLLTADWKVSPRLVLSFNGIYSYFSGEFWNRNFTFVAANDNANVNNGRSTVGGDGVTTVIATRAPSGSVNNVAQLNNGGGTSDKLTYTRTFTPRFEYKWDRWVIDGAFGFSESKNNYESIEKGFSNNEGGGAPGSWIATRPSPESWEWTIRQTSGADWFDLRSFNSTDARSGGTRITNDDRTWTTTKWTGTANAKWALPFFERLPTVVKFGGKWDEELRDNNHHTDTNIWAYTGPGGNTTTVSPTTGANQNATFGHWLNVGPQFVSANPFETGKSNALTLYNIAGVQGMAPRVSRQAIANLYHERPDLFTYMGTPENYYANYIANKRDFKQTISAGYGQADVRITPKLRTLFGVRYEETRNELVEFDPLTRAQVIAAGYAVNAPGTAGGRALTLDGIKYQYESQPKKTRRSNYHNWFPSISMKYNILQNLEWHAGWNKSIGRPPINALSGVWVIDENAQRVSAPNPEIQPEYHKKLMTRFAYYFSGRSPGSLALSLSRTEFTNALAQFDLTAEQFGNEDPDFANYTFRTQSNIQDRTVFTKNMDLSYRQTLGFIPSEYFRGITVFANFTRSYVTAKGGTGLIRRPNLAPYRVAGGVSYSYRRFSASYNVIWADDKPESNTYGRYFRELTKVDLTLGWKLTNNVSLYVQGRNIRNAPDRWMQSPPGVQEGEQGYLRQMEEYGANWTFGIKGTF